MIQRETISIQSYQDTTTEHEWLRQQSEVLFVLLPGLASTTNSPPLFYSARLAEDLKCDYVAINYSFHAAGMPYREEDAWSLVGDIKKVVDICLSKNDYRQIVFIGKSLGSIATMAIVDDYSANYKTHIVLLTPIPEYTNKIIEREQFIAFGTADHFIDQSVIDNYRKYKNITLHIVENGSHSLAVDNVVDSIEVMKRLIIELRNYLERRLF